MIEIDGSPLQSNSLHLTISNWSSDMENQPSALLRIRSTPMSSVSSTAIGALPMIFRSGNLSPRQSAATRTVESGRSLPSIFSTRIFRNSQCVVNVVDLFALQSKAQHPHGLADDVFDRLFTRDRPVIFAYHGYPYLIPA